MPNAVTHLKELRQKVADELRQRDQRPPNAVEAASIEVLSRITRELAPEVMAVFDRGTLHYTLTATEAVLRELRMGRAYRSREIYLAERVFVTDFAEALAVFLHEHSHIFGADGERGFTDALTDLLETLIRERNAGPLRGRVGNCPTGCRAGKTTGADCRAWRNRPTCGWRRLANLMSENSKGVCTSELETVPVAVSPRPSETVYLNESAPR